MRIALNIKCKLFIINFLILNFLCLNNDFANAKDISIQFDNVRMELSNFQDKNSKSYIKAKQKLDKIIKQDNIDYSINARINDIERLIVEQKYSIAIYELNDLIENNIELSKSYEFLGDIALKTNKDSKKVAQYYKNSIKYDEENVSSLFKLACLYLKSEKNILAIENFKLAVEKTDNFEILNNISQILKTKIVPKNRYEANNLYEILGLIYLKLGNPNYSQVAFDKALKLNPNDIFLKYYLANLFYENDNHQQAVKLFDSILAQNSYDSAIRLMRADSFYQLSNLIDSQKDYEKILEDDPRLKFPKIRLYKIFQGKFALDKILKRIMNYNQDYVLTQKDYDNFADLLAEFGENIEADKVRNYLISCENIKKENKETKTNKQEQKQAKIVKKENNIKKTTKVDKIAKNKENNAVKEKISKKEKEEIIKKANEEKIKQEKIKKDEQVKLLKAQEFEKKAIANETKKAIEKDYQKYQKLTSVINKYLETKNKTVDVYFAIANTYKQLEMPYSAIKYYNEAKKINPVNSDIYYNLGLTYFELNSFVSAKSYLQKAINLDNENKKAKNLLAFVDQSVVTQIINKAYDKYEKKEFVESFKILDDGIKKYPNNSQLFYYRALVTFEMGRNGASIIDLQKAIELDASNYMAYYQLGLVYEKIKDERSALVAYERFLSIEPQEDDLVQKVQKKVIDLGSKYY